MKQILPYFILLIIIFSAVFYLQTKGLPQSLRLQSLLSTPSADLTKTPTLTISNKVTVEIDLAETPEQHTKGLSGRKPLKDKQGMLFEFSTPHIPGFWMKEMKFDLDMIWIDSKNTIVDIHENVPHPNSKDSVITLPIYSPKIPVKSILEVNAGFVKKYNVVIGDSITVTK